MSELKPNSPDHITAERLAEIKARHEAATPGPWKWSKAEYACGLGPGEGCIYPAELKCKEECIYIRCWLDASILMAQRLNIDMFDANAAFIAHARADIPALLAEVERLKAELAEAKASAVEWVTYDGTLSSVLNNGDGVECLFFNDESTAAVSAYVVQDYNPTGSEVFAWFVGGCKKLKIGDQMAYLPKPPKTVPVLRREDIKRL